MIIQRLTLNDTVRYSGKGLHSGEPVSIAIHPGGNGIWFHYGAEKVEAVAENVSDTTRCTHLGSISTVEHVMSALAGLGVTDAVVETDFPEMPGADGSARPFVELIERVGTVATGEREIPDLYRRIFFQEDDLKIAISKGEGIWRYDYVNAPRWPGEQSFEMSGTSAYRDEVAPARTFALLEEIGQITAMGLGLGLDENSCLVLGDEDYKNLARFPDEPARHKLLDLIGDLALCGFPIAGLNVVAERSGHRTNVAAAAMLRQALKENN